MIMHNHENNTKQKGYLAGQLLVATPSVQDSCFAKSVIYVLAHDDSGAMGIVVNQVINNANCSLIFNHLEIDCSGLKEDLPIHFGGPVESARGFVLHTRDYEEGALQLVHTPIALSSNVQILKEIASGRGPSKSIFALGYAGWEPGQLDAELETNSWLTVPATEDLVFETSNSTKWQKAVRAAGIKNPYNLMPDVGHA